MLQHQLKHIIHNKTKPPGALGLLEETALQVGLIQKTTTPVIQLPHIVVFAADHGIAATGLVNPYPQAVTAQMVKNFLTGGAAINVFCRQNNIALTIVDAGVNYNWSEAELQHENFVIKKMNHGTKNFLHGPAMSAEECSNAITAGREVVQEIYSTGCNTIGLGEMGISNTSSASLIMSSITGMPVEQCVGNGTGASESQLRAKTTTLQQAAGLHRIQDLKTAPRALLAAVGGFEIAMMCGDFLQAAELGMVILVDGFIATAALLLACAMEPGVQQNCLFAHCGDERGHRLMLDYLGAKPMLQIGLRLGEGTGAALALPLVQAAVGFLNEMASFASAGIDQSSL
jgi:nicotinate-nucleotide--dimethylbenzimidazole phosphoribosyltransferase